MLRVDRAEAEAEDADDDEVESGADHCPCDAGMRERDVDVLPVQERLSDEERDQRAGSIRARVTSP